MTWQAHFPSDPEYRDLVELCRAMVRKLCQRYDLDICVEVLDELAQDVIVKFGDRYGKVSGPLPWAPKTIIFTMARDVVVGHVRKEGLWAKYMDHISENPHEHAQTVEPDQTLEESPGELLRREIEQLGLDDTKEESVRLAFAAAHTPGVETDAQVVRTVAEQMGYSKRSVYAWYNNIAKALNAKMVVHGVTWMLAWASGTALLTALLISIMAANPAVGAVMGILCIFALAMIISIWLSRPMAGAAVVFCLAMVVLPMGAMAVDRAREHARLVQCENNLKQIGIALHNHHDQYRKLPSARYQKDRNEPVFGSRGCWATKIVAYMEQAELGHQVEMALWDGDETSPAYRATVYPYICPENANRSMDGRIDYCGVAGSVGVYPHAFAKENGGMFQPDMQGVSLEMVLDGTSNTVMVGERPAAADGSMGRFYISDLHTSLAMENHIKGADDCSGPGVYGPGKSNNPCDQRHFWSQHHGGGNCLFADGSVRFIGYDVGPSIMNAFATRAGNDRVADFMRPDLRYE